MISIPIELLEQFERGNVLLFIGEQILSDVAGRATIDELTAELIARTQIDHEEELDFPAIAQLYQDQQNRHALVQFVSERLKAPEYKPQPVHRLIAQLSACRVIVTTCLDQRLEEALTAAGRPFDLIIGGVDVAFEDAQKTQLYKLPRFCGTP